MAIFKVQVDGTLEHLAVVPSGGKCPRYFAIAPCGKVELASNQDSGTIRVFQRNIDS